MTAREHASSCARCGNASFHSLAGPAAPIRAPDHHRGQGPWFRALACSRCALTLWFAEGYAGEEAVPSSGECRACSCPRAWRVPATDGFSALVCDGCGLTDWVARNPPGRFRDQEGACGRCGAAALASEDAEPADVTPLAPFRAWLHGRRPSGWLHLRFCRACGQIEWYASARDLQTEAAP